MEEPFQRRADNGILKERQAGIMAGLFSSLYSPGNARMRSRSRAARQRAFLMLSQPLALSRL